MKPKKFFLFKKSNIKLLLYVLSATLTSLLADIKRYTEPCKNPISSLDDLSSVNLLYIITNFTLQGIIAWRAFMDTSCKEDPSLEEDCCDENASGASSVSKPVSKPTPVERTYRKPTKNSGGSPI